MNGALCVAVDCQSVIQACCLPDDSCADVRASECRDLGGNAQGDGTACATTTCGTPVEPVACCMPDATCQDISRDECEAAGGNPKLRGSTCDTARCGRR